MAQASTAVYRVDDMYVIAAVRLEHRRMHKTLALHTFGSCSAHFRFMLQSTELSGVVEPKELKAKLNPWLPS